jgi:hypothetical protein
MTKCIISALGISSLIFGKLKLTKNKLQGINHKNKFRFKLQKKADLDTNLNKPLLNRKVQANVHLLYRKCFIFQARGNRKRQAAADAESDDNDDVERDESEVIPNRGRKSTKRTRKWTHKKSPAVVEEVRNPAANMRPVVPRNKAALEKQARLEQEFANQRKVSFFHFRH